MCIAIYKPSDKQISQETLQTCWTANPDGAGYMYVHNGKLKVKKGFMSFESFYESFKHFQDRKAVLHFRIKTHGETNPENTHPFKVSHIMGFVHNGIISKVSTVSDKTKSDTWHFNEQILKPLFKLSKDFVYNEAVQELIDNYIGSSKLIFMDNEENVLIFNKNMGEMSDGVWYSNSSYIPRKAVTHLYQQGTYYPSKHSYHTPQTTNIIPYKKEEKKDDISKLEVNTLVSLREPYLNLEKGMLGIVETFYQDHTCGVLFFEPDSTSSFFKRVPIYLLDISDDDMIVHHYYYS